MQIILTTDLTMPQTKTMANKTLRSHYYQLNFVEAAGYQGEKLKIQDVKSLTESLDECYEINLFPSKFRIPIRTLL